jgi:hypothetical protein
MTIQQRPEMEQQADQVVEPEAEAVARYHMVVQETLQ